MAKLLLVTAILFVLGISFSFASNSDIIYFFSLNSTTISGVLKNGSCTNLASSTIQGSSPSTTVEGPGSSDSAVSLASDNWIDLGDYRGTCISDPAFCTSSGMTVAFWLRLDAGGSGDRHVINTGRMDTSRGIQVFYTSSHTNVVLCDGTKRYPAEIEFPGYWTHVVAVYNSSGSTAADKFFVYVNGTKKETARYETSCTVADTETNLFIGHDTNGSLTGGREVALSQLAFYFKALSQADVQAIYSNPSSGIQLNCPESTTASPTTTAASTSTNAPTGTTAAASTAAGSTAAGSTAAGSTAAGSTNAGSTAAASTAGASTAGSTANTSSTAETASSTSSSSGATPSPESTGSSSGQGQDKDDQSRSPTVLILLSLSLLFLLVIVIILIIGCCVIVPRAKEKGYKFL